MCALLYDCVVSLFVYVHTYVYILVGCVQGSPVYCDCCWLYKASGVSFSWLLVVLLLV